MTDYELMAELCLRAGMIMEDVCGDAVLAQASDPEALSAIVARIRLTSLIRSLVVELVLALGSVGKFHPSQDHSTAEDEVDHVAFASTDTDELKAHRWSPLLVPAPSESQARGRDTSIAIKVSIPHTPVRAAPTPRPREA